MFRLLPFVLVVGCGLLKPSNDDDDGDDWTSENGGGAPPSLFGDDEEPSASDDDGGTDGGGDSSDGDGDGPSAEEAPMIIIEGPMNGEEYLQTEIITVIAQVQDNEQDWDTIQTSIISSRDGQLWSGFPDEAGIVQLDTVLSAGSHTITVKAVDDDTNQNTESVAISVVADARPAVMITQPGSGDWFWNSDMIRFEAEVSDDFTHPQDLTIRWISDIDGVFGSLAANTAGIVGIDTILSAGYHLITLAVTDTDENTTEESINLEVRDPLAHDADLDGYSELAGDCDDADPYTSPGAAEVCDVYDNDCDGELNEDFIDEIEPSDSIEDAHDLGTIDGASGFLGVGGESVSVSSGLTLHTADDEDWLYFDADDDWFDDPNFSVSVGAFPTGGTYVVELYSADVPTGTDSETEVGPADYELTLEATAVGSGSLSVLYESEGGFLGGLFSGSGDDDFWIRIYSEDWVAYACDSELVVEIEAL